MCDVGKTKHEKSCGAIIIAPENGNYKVLMVKHQNGGHWSFPKGHVENGETETQTALREIKEETGMDVALDTNFRHVVTYSPKRGTLKDVVFFAAKPLSSDLKRQKKEIAEIRWVPLVCAPNLVSFDTDRELLASITQYVRQSTA